MPTHSWKACGQHGGANAACWQTRVEIGDVSRFPELIARAKDQNDSFKLMGFGHRVYKNFDPGAKLMSGVCNDGGGPKEADASCKMFFAGGVIWNGYQERSIRRN